MKKIGFGYSFAGSNLSGFLSVPEGVFQVGNQDHVSDASGNWISQPTGAATGSSSQLFKGFPIALFVHEPLYRIRLRTTSDISALRFWFGLGGGTPQQTVGNGNTDNADMKWFGLRYSSGIDAGWVLIYNDGITQSEFPIALNVAASTEYTLTFTVKNAGTLGTVTIESPDTKKSKTVTIALAAEPVFFEAYVYTKEDVSKSFEFDNVAYEIELGQ